MEQQRIAGALGLIALPDHLADRIACMLATHRFGRKRSKGHTPARVTAALRRIESRMHRGHDGPQAAQEITDPHFNIDTETFDLAPIVFNPDVPLDRKIDAVAERRREGGRLATARPVRRYRMVDGASQRLAPTWDGGQRRPCVLPGSTHPWRATACWRGAWEAFAGNVTRRNEHITGRGDRLVPPEARSLDHRGDGCCQLAG
jgi:hypothetical protein